MLVNNNTLHHTANPTLIIKVNSDNKACIPEGIIIGTLERTNKEKCYMKKLA